MDVQSVAFLGALMGSAFGLPLGFLLIEVIKGIASRIASRCEQSSDILEWAISQRGCRVVEETQVANFWVRTLDFTEIMTTGNDGAPVSFEPGHLEQILPSMYAVQVTGGVAGSPGPIPALSLVEAHEVHSDAVASVRKKMGLRARV